MVDQPEPPPPTSPVADGGGDPVADEEWLLRKVSVRSGRYDGESGRLLPESFMPIKTDETGISLDRQRSAERPEFRTPKQAACGDADRQPDGYFVARLSVTEVRALGLTVKPDPLPDNPGHVLIPEMSYPMRKSKDQVEKNRVLAGEAALAQRVAEVLGPFPTIQHPPHDEPSGERP